MIVFAKSSEKVEKFFKWSLDNNIWNNKQLVHIDRIKLTETKINRLLSTNYLKEETEQENDIEVRRIEQNR